MKKFFILFLFSLLAISCTGNRGGNVLTGSTGKSTPHRIVCLSTTHIAALHAIGADSLIVGVSGAQYISNQLINRRLKKGTVTDIGYEASINWETLLSLKPDIVFVYDIAGENAPYIQKMKRFKLNVVKINDFNQESPLKRLEILKQFGKILGKESAADSIINDITIQYNTLKKKVASCEKVPVLINAPYKEVWYIPGKDNYMSKMISDAGGEIEGSREGEMRSFPYSVESAFVFARNAKIWLLQNNDQDMKIVSAENPLFSKIPAFESGNVWNNNLRVTAGGGNDFWESGIVEPQYILEDLIRIFHPGTLPEGSFHFYRKLD
ncbi:MAG: ABC transporter substrate-binding protein [Bacteroidales bacterium]|nr:ABC transporter substrate-binding protein [Bacteroidales bacterium]MCI2121214.1 ABC transporter substrate-binding protein [Bacteroidales bacterium]MCI2145996.1 ABC transporter substrate-binding protein [Bacteroidales bacterium]